MRPLRDDSALAARAAELVRVLAHPDRIRVVAALCAADAGALELAGLLDLPRGQVARHLAALEAARLVAPSPGAAGPRYRVAEPALHGLVACMEDCSR